MKAEQKRILKVVFDSLEPEILSDLKRLDHRIRILANECSILGIKSKYIDEEIRNRIYRYIKEISC